MNSRPQPGYRPKTQVAKMDKNLHFLTLLDRKIEYEPPGKINFKEHLRKIKRKIADLSQDQRQQWSESLTLKCVALHRAIKQKEVVLSLRVLIEVSNEYDSNEMDMLVRYEADAVERIIKEIYYEQYGKNVVGMFKEAGYEVRQFQTWEYQDPWYTRLFNSVINIF